MRSRLQFAAYALGNNGQSPPNLNLNTLTSSTNPPASTPETNQLQISTIGTVFYGRSSTNSTNDSIWAINLDGSDDMFVTTGVRPRVSRDGHYLAFLRGGSPLVTQGNLWVRNLRTGQESLLYANTNFTICYDWDLSDTNLIFDWDCGIWQISPGQSAPTQLSLLNDCYDDAPVVNPSSGILAFHNLNPNPAIAGLYETTTNHPPVRQKLGITVPGASWPEWSPDGQKLAFADNNISSAFTADDGTNLYVAQANSSNVFQITLFTNGTDAFPTAPCRRPSPTTWSAPGPFLAPMASGSSRLRRTTRNATALPSCCRPLRETPLTSLVRLSWRRRL